MVLNNYFYLRRTWRVVDFAVQVHHKVKLKDSEKKDKFQDLARERKKTMEHESDGDINYNWCSLQSPKDWYKD